MCRIIFLLFLIITLCIPSICSESPMEPRMKAQAIRHKLIPIITKMKGKPKDIQVKAVTVTKVERTHTLPIQANGKPSLADVNELVRSIESNQNQENVFSMSTNTANLQRKDASNVVLDTKSMYADLISKMTNDVSKQFRNLVQPRIYQDIQSFIKSSRDVPESVQFRPKGEEIMPERFTRRSFRRKSHEYAPIIGARDIDNREYVERGRHFERRSNGFPPRESWTSPDPVATLSLEKLGSFPYDNKLSHLERNDRIPATQDIPASYRDHTLLHRIQRIPMEPSISHLRDLQPLRGRTRQQNENWHKTPDSRIHLRQKHKLIRIPVREEVLGVLTRIPNDSIQEYTVTNSQHSINPALSQQRQQDPTYIGRSQQFVDRPSHPTQNIVQVGNQRNPEHFVQSSSNLDRRQPQYDQLPNYQYISVKTNGHSQPVIQTSLPMSSGHQQLTTHQQSISGLQTNSQNMIYPSSQTVGYRNVDPAFGNHGYHKQYGPSTSGSHGYPIRPSVNQPRLETIRSIQVYHPPPPTIQNRQMQPPQSIHSNQIYPQETIVRSHVQPPPATISQKIYPQKVIKNSQLHLPQTIQQQMLPAPATGQNLPQYLKSATTNEQLQPFVSSKPNARSTHVSVDVKPSNKLVNFQLAVDPVPEQSPVLDKRIHNGMSTITAKEKIPNTAVHTVSNTNYPQLIPYPQPNTQTTQIAGGQKSGQTSPQHVLIKMAVDKLHLGNNLLPPQTLASPTTSSGNNAGQTTKSRTSNCVVFCMKR